MLPSMNPKLYLLTYGCQMNEYDSSKMADVMGAAEGYVPTDDVEQAVDHAHAQQHVEQPVIAIQNFAHALPCGRDAEKKPAQEGLPCAGLALPVTTSS